MKSSQTIFNKTHGTITIDRARWEEINYKLQRYQELCRELREVLEDES